MALTDLKVKAAKAGEKPYKLTDAQRERQSGSHHSQLHRLREPRGLEKVLRLSSEQCGLR